MGHDNYYSIASDDPPSQGRNQQKEDHGCAFVSHILFHTFAFTAENKCI